MAVESIEFPAGSPAAAPVRGTPLRVSAAHATVLACAAAVIILLQIVAAGAPARLEGLDTDDYMRLQEVRDFIGGQPWADVDQRRLETPEGGSIHFSRLPDAPMAAILVAARPFLGEAGAETLLLNLWPAGLLLLYLFAANAAAAEIDPKSRILHAIFAAASISTIVQFKPGRIDHHSLQIALVCLALYFALRSVKRPGAGFFAGALAVLMLTIGMETAPYAAALAIAVALPWIVNGEEKGLAWFGAGLLTAAPLALVAARFGGNLGAVECDAYSLPQLTAAMLAGGGALLLARLTGRLPSARRRFAAAAAAGAAALISLAAGFPACMAGPYAGLDPMVADLWLKNVAEARTLFAVLELSPERAGVAYLFPAVAIAAGAANALQTRGAVRLQHAMILALLTAAFAVSVWQFRGAAFANALAAIPTALLLARLDARPNDGSRRIRPLAVLGPAALSPAPALLLSALLALGAADAPKEPAATCKGPRAAFERLNAAPAGLVLTQIDMGPPLIALTHHSATSAPYHRNVGGIKRSLAFFSADEAEARALLLADPADYVLVCPTAAEFKLLAKRYPDSLAASFMEGRAPGWLEEMPTGENRFRFYRVALDEGAG